MNLTPIVETSIPYIVAVVVILYIMKYVKKYMEKRDKKKKVEKVRSHEDRIYLGLKRIAKSTSLLKHKPIYVKGDGLVPGHKVGETVTGVIPMPDCYVTFYRKKWWYFWQKPVCLQMAPELASDLNGGEFHVLGRGIEPLGERYSYVIPPSKYFDKVSIEDVERRRSRIALKRSVRLLNHDLNNDIPTTVKTALRGREPLSELELYETGDIPKERKERYEREQERKREELREERRKSSGGTQQQQQMIQAGGGGL